MWALSDKRLEQKMGPMFSFCLDELQRRQDHTFFDLRRMTKACWLKDEEEPGTIQDSIYLDLLHRIVKAIETNSQDD